VEVFGDKGSVAMKYPKTLELLIGTEKKPLELGTLEGARAEPIRYFVDCIRNNKSVGGVVSGDFNVDVMQIVEAARLSAMSGKPVNLPIEIK
jgi:predicted dehydrogenase